MALTPGFAESPKLEPAASFVAHKQVQVMCASDYTAWKQFAGTHGDANGLATPGTDVMYLSPDACAFMRARQRAKPVALYSIGASILGLTHESVHLRGETDEGKTDCAASHEMVAVAQRFFGFKTRAAIRALMAQVAKYRTRVSSIYRTVC